MSAQAVVGRDVELGRISAFLAGVGDGPGALVLSGAPGIGKTVLWEHGVEEATSRGLRVLAHRAVEAEAGLAFTGLADLLTPVLDDVLSALTPPRRRALAVALLIEDAGDAPAPELGAIGLALMDALRVLADSAQVIVAVDDIQWLDSSTAGVLPLALRRLEHAPVATLATLRVAPDVRAPFELARTFSRLEEVPLDPLGVSELHRLLKDRVGLELSRPELRQVLEASGGNPFFALEIGREFARTRGSIRVPASLRDALGGRLARLPAQTMDVLLAAAASARPTVDLTLAASDAPREAVLDALDGAAHEGVVLLEEERIRFGHPLLASLSYERAAPWKRRAVHARLATAVDDAEERARHLALAADGADAAVAAELEAAAQHAAARGATAAAAELAELADARTPPSDVAGRRRRRRAAADFHHLAGDFGRATELLAVLAEELPPGGERADVLHARARIGRDDLPTRARLAEQALREAGDDDALAAQILGFLAIHRWVLGSVPDGVRDAREGLARAERLGDPRVMAIAIAGLGFLETLAGEVTPDLLERGAEIEAGLDQPLLFIQSSSFMLAVHLMATDGLDRARSMLEDFIQWAAERGDEHTRQWAILQLVNIEGWAGRLRRALDWAAEARAIAEQTQEVQYRGMVECFAAPVEADVGLLEQARRSAEEGLRSARSVSDEVFTIANTAALGHLELVLGNMRAAADQLRDLPDRLARIGEINPLRDCSADAIEALTAVGQLEQARRYLNQSLEVAPRLNRRSRVGTWRSAGLVTAAEGDRARALDAFERALAADDDPPLYPLERARTLLAMGGVQRQALQRRAARETLEKALAMFEELGARPWAEKARDELSRISGRRAPSDELTEAERRVAVLAAQGRQNKEIAAELFLSEGTVERHLTSAYRKLGVRSRAQLAGRFSRDQEQARHGG